jgi:hypothetical protein
LESLSDVSITAAASGDILRHDGSDWVDVFGADWYSPSGHNHDADYSTLGHAHGTEDITDFETDVSGFVTYGVLDANSDVGIGSDQVASGSHAHNADYSPLGHAHITGDITAFETDVSGFVTYETLDANSDVGTSAGQVAIGDHDHAGVYSPVGHPHATTDITDFETDVSGLVTYEVLDANSDVGTGAGQLAIGDHNHDGSYSALGHAHGTEDITDFGTDVSGFVTYESLDGNSDVGTGATQVAQGDHSHTFDGLSDVVITSAASGNVAAYDGSNWVNEGVRRPIAIGVEDPTATENITLFYTDKPMTIELAAAVIVGSTSVDWNIAHSTPIKPQTAPLLETYPLDSPILPFQPNHGCG